MKICFLTINLFCMGGVQRVLSNIANALSIENEVTIICIGKINKIDRSVYNLNNNINIISTNIFDQNKISKAIRKLILKIHKNTKILDSKLFYRVLENLYISDKAQKNLIQILNEDKYDVVIGVEGFLSYLLGSISEFINTRTIGWQHNSFDAYFNTPGKYYWKRDFIFKKYLSKLDEVVVLTHNDEVKFNNRFNIKTTKIYNPLSFTSTKRSNLSSQNILFVGRLEEQQKGLDLLIKSFNLVHKKRPDWKLIIVGEGTDREKLCNDIKNYGLCNSVVIHPFTNRIQEFYSNASIFVSTSRWEGFGLVILEAMQSGLPIISFNNTGPIEIINKPGENGVIVPSSDIELFAEEIIQLIDNEDLRREIGTRSIERAKEFEVDKILEDWQHILYI